MSNVLDDNVVILRFDNSDFEKNTKQSMETLDKLKNATNKTSGESLDGLSKAANKVNLNGIGKAIDTVNKRFSLFGIAGMATINRLTNSAITSTARMVTAIPRQAIQGGWQRALNIEQAKNLIDGLGNAWDENSEKYKAGMKTVKTAVDNAVTGTRYALDEAAIVASQLLSSGVKDTDALEESLKSISGLASVLNADYGDIGRIFAQVAGQGRMMGDDLLQLQQRGIGAAEEIAKYLNLNKDVAKAALDSAIAQGKQVKKMEEIKEHGEITGADVREMVSAGAINFDILSGSFRGLFEQAEKANDTYTGSLANLKSAVNRIGESFMKIKLESFTKLFNALIPVVKRFKELLDPLAERVNKTAEAFTKFIVNGVINPFGEAIGAKNLFTKLGYAAKDTADKVTGANKDIQKSSQKTDKDILKLNKEYQAARDIWYKGTYGNGSRRKNALEQIGVSYTKTQSIINQFYKDGFKWDNIEKQLIQDYKDKAEAAGDAADATGKAAESTDEQSKKYPAIISLLKSFINLVTSVKFVLLGFKNIIFAVASAIKKAITPSLKTGAGLFEKLTEKILAASIKFYEFSKILTDSEKRTEWLKNHQWVDIFVKAISTGFAFAKEAILGFVGVIKEFFSQFTKSEGFNALKEQLKDLMGVLKDLAGGALEKVTGQLGKLSNVGGSSNMTKIVGFFSALAGGLANMIASIRRGENPLKNFTGIMGRVKEALSFKSLKKEGVSASVNALSAKNGTVAMVVNASKSLKKAKVPEHFNKASDAIFNFFGRLTSKIKNVDIGGKLKTIFEALKKADWGQISKTAFYMGSLAAVIKAVRDSGRLVDAAVGTLGSISGLFKSLSNISNVYAQQIKVQNFQLLAISVAILIGSIVALAAVPTERLKPAIIGVVTILGLLAGIMVLMSSKKFNPQAMTQVGASFAAMGASLLLVAFACKVLAGIDGEGLLKAGVALVAFMGMFMLIGKMKTAAVLSGSALVGMAVAVNLLVAAVAVLAIMPWNAILKGATAIALIMTELAIAARLAGFGGATGLVSMAIALNLLIPAIVIFAIMPVDKAMRGAVVACTIIAMIGLASRTASSSAGNMASIVSMTAMVVALSAALVILSFIDTKKLLTAATALTTTMLSLAAAAFIANKSKVGLLTMSLTIGMMAAAIITLIKIDAQSAITVANSLAVLAASLSIAFGIFSVIGVKGSGIAVAGLSIAIAGITAILAGLGALYKSETVRNLLTNGSKIADQLGKAIGSFVGNIVSGFGVAATSGLSDMASNISGFAKEIKPFLNMVNGLDTSSVEGAKALADAIFQITKADFVESLSVFSGVEDLASRMEELGKGFVAFSNAVKSVPEDTVDKTVQVSKVIKTLATSFGEIPKTGGKLQWFTGEVDVVGFIDGILSVAKALGDNGKLTGLKELEIPDDLLGKGGKITKIAKVIKTMADAVNEIPETGGFKQKIIGFADIGGFAQGIVDFAMALGGKEEGLQSIATITIPDGLTADNGPITKICQVIAAMSEAANLIPESEGIKQGILGNTTINEFAEQLAAAIPSLEKFINAVADKELKFGDGIKEKVIRIATAIGAMGEASQLLPESGGFKQTVFGGSDISDFASKLAEAMPGLQTFISSAKTIKIDKSIMDKINPIADAVSAMSKVARSLPKSDGVWQKLTGEKNIGKFGGQLAKLIGSLSEVKGNVKINTEAINNAAAGLKAITPAVQSFKDVTPIPTGSNLPKLAQNAASFAEQLSSIPTKGLKSKASAIASASKQFSSNAAKGIAAGSKNVNLSSSGSSLASSFLSGLSGKMSTATSAGKSLANKVKSGAGSVSLNSVGKNVGAGFVNGINSKQSAAYRAGSALGYKAKQGAKNAVDSSSPAKEFIKLGKYSGEGLVIGLKSYEGKVYRSGYSMGESSMDGTEDALRNMIYDVSDPVITPVVDLSNVNRGLDTINNEFSRNRAMTINSGFESADVRNTNMLNAMAKSISKMGNQNQPNNYFTFNVDGAENPEDFAKRFVRQVQLEMRTG